ncbi:unnamed protein product [Arctogadus glacialis]
MSTSSPDDPILHQNAFKKIAYLKEDIRRLSDELRRKETQLSSLSEELQRKEAVLSNYTDLAMEQSKQISTLMRPSKIPSFGTPPGKPPCCCDLRSESWLHISSGAVCRCPCSRTPANHPVCLGAGGEEGCSAAATQRPSACITSADPVSTVDNQPG